MEEIGLPECPGYTQTRDLEFETAVGTLLQVPWPAGSSLLLTCVRYCIRFFGGNLRYNRTRHAEDTPLSTARFRHLA